MSETHHSSPKMRHDDGSPPKPGRYSPSQNQPARRLLFSLLLLLLLLLLAGITALVLYLVYRPSHPHFSITSAAVFALENSTPSAEYFSPAAVSSSMQFTLVIRNPSGCSSIYYDRLGAYATYRGQPITPPAALPPLFQESDSEVSVSPVLGGAGAPVPASADVEAGLATDKAYGVVALRLVVLGRLRFKSGPFYSGWRSLYVRCDVLVGLKGGVSGQVPLLGTPGCHVYV